MWFSLVLAFMATFATSHATVFGDYKVSAWYFLRYTLPAESQLTSLSGEMIIPPLEPAHGGTYYIWPGLQVENWDGIYQNVLSGNDSGTWTLWSGYCCENPILPWSGSFDTYEGETVSFSNVKGKHTWTTVQTREKTGQRIPDKFDALGKYFQVPILSILHLSPFLPLPYHPVILDKLMRLLDKTNL